VRKRGREGLFAANPLYKWLCSDRGSHTENATHIQQTVKQVSTSLNLMVDRAALVQFGLTVRQLRLKAGLSQETLALRASIHRTYIGGIERGERNPTLLMIVRIARALDVPVAKIFEVQARVGNEFTD